MNTYADIKIDGKVATLIQNGKTLTLTATDGEWSTFKLDFTDQPRRQDYPAPFETEGRRGKFLVVGLLPVTG